MQSFFEEAFGLQIPSLDCDHDSDTIKSLIMNSMDMIEDGFDYIGIFESIQYVVQNRNKFLDAFKDCSQILIVL